MSTRAHGGADGEYGAEYADAVAAFKARKFDDTDGTYAESRAFPRDQNEGSVLVGDRETRCGSPSVILPTDSAERKEIPIVSGVLDYFPNAVAYVAMISKKGNDKHNPGQPLHWSVNKSTDHAECIGRHLLDRGTIDPTDGMRHSGMLAWRALAHLEEELVAAGAPRGRGAYAS